MIGKHISKNKEAILSHLPSKNYYLILFALITAFLSVFLNKYTLNLSEIPIIMFSILLFMLAIKNPTFSIAKPLEFIGDKLSLNVYIFHPLFGGIIYKFINLFGFTQNNIWLTIRPIITAVVSLLVSWILYKINVSVELAILKKHKTI